MAPEIDKSGIEIKLFIFLLFSLLRKTILLFKIVCLLFTNNFILGKYEPLCGSDCATYFNYCELQNKNCQQGTNYYKFSDNFCPLFCKFCKTQYSVSFSKTQRNIFHNYNHAFQPIKHQIFFCSFLIFISPLHIIST